MKHIKSVATLFWNEFLYGGHLQCIGAVGVVIMSFFLLEAKISWDILLVTYLLFHPIYVWNRSREISIDSITNPARTAHLAAVLPLLKFLVPIAILISLGLLLAFSTFGGVIFGITVLVFGILYTEFFKGLTRIIPGFKNFYVAAVFALFVFFPFIYYPYLFSQLPLFPALVLALWVFLNTITMQIFLDIKDIEGDKQQKLLTFPSLWGKERAFMIFSALTIFTNVPVILFFTLVAPLLKLEALALMGIIPVSLYAVKLAKQGDYRGYLIKSGELALWPLFIALWHFLS